MKKITLHVLLSSCLLACHVDYTIENSQPKRRLVVDGLITTLADSSRIILSYTSANFRTGSIEFVKNAEVTVSDSDGNKNIFTLSKKGKYISQGFVGKTGKSYHLKVSADGATYEADDALSPVTPILKLDYAPYKDEDVADNSYRVRYHVAKQSGLNYYKVTQYINGKKIIWKKSVLVYNDETMKNQVNIVPALGLYKAKDTARVDLQSISERAFKYYFGLNNVMQSDGGIFSPPAANPYSNISNGGLGFFLATDNSHRETKLP